MEKASVEARAYIDKHTLILPLLNSVTPTPTLQELFPNNKVLYGYITKIDSYKKGDGFYYNIPGDIHFGYADNSVIKEEIERI